MASSNFDYALQFVWRPDFDSPEQGYHDEPGDPGGGTFGGVIEATWAGAVRVGMVRGTLREARLQQLSAVLRGAIWSAVGDALPTGVDLLFFNGKMMSGGYSALLQQSLGFMGPSVDGHIGPLTLAAVSAADAATLINALSGIHYSYLTRLTGWGQFGAGWTTRLKAAQAAALALVRPAGRL
jgi:lysozyme family protein